MTRIEFSQDKAVITMPRKEYDMLRAALTDLEKTIIRLDGGDYEGKRKGTQAAAQMVGAGGEGPAQNARHRVRAG